jgi:S-formylglutathione hydrolase FrmB
MKALLAGFVVAAAVAAPLSHGGAAAPSPDEPALAQLEPRIWSCDFQSRALGQPMRFLVVLPEGATLASAPLPAIYFLHGRGRHERTLLEAGSTRRRVLASPCAVILPRGRDGWYVNSPVIPADRYADYTDEVIALAERHFPLGRGARSRAIGGWSMGGYGAAYTAARRGDFAAAAPIIGILDYPRPDIDEPGQNYTVQPRFGTDPAAWAAVNPRLLLPRLRETPLFVAYADQAAERQMNETFLAEARAAGFAVEELRMAGGHTFPMVEQALPAAFDFLERTLAARRQKGAPAGDFTLVRSLAELRPHLSRNGARVRLAPGTYRLDAAESENFLHFTGHDSHFDFTGVRLEVETALLARFRAGTNLLLLSGDRILLEGLALETLGEQAPPGGCRAISLLGRGVIVRDVALRLSGSHPYGYGSFFGIGAGASITPQKLNGIRVGGIDNQVIGCRVIMRCFGHGIFLRGAQHALVKDCYVEGALRRTDDILAEKTGPAFALGFRQYTGAPIPPGEMTSLSEDGIRAYPNDPETKRRTHDLRVENCRVVRMRRGICLAYAAGRNEITGCEVTESERVAFHVQSATTLRDCRADALYSQVLDISTAGARRSDVEIAVLDSRAFYGHRVLATINGSGHRVVLREAGPGFVPSDLSVDLGQARSAPGAEPEASQATRVTLENRTGATVVLHPTAAANTIASTGAVTDRGAGNQGRKLE